MPRNTEFVIFAYALWLGGVGLYTIALLRRWNGLRRAMGRLKK
ncbi:MAG: hypothetical protein OEV94_10515 [Deltaproteobacteria bacterium]|nr:hypothetical protein [Deltaproteobacteria bacterium]